MPQVIEQSLFLFFIKVQSKSVPVAAPMAKEAEDSTASSCREQKSLKMQRKTFFLKKLSYLQKNSSRTTGAPLVEARARGFCGGRLGTQPGSKISKTVCCEHPQ